MLLPHFTAGYFVGVYEAALKARGTNFISKCRTWLRAQLAA